MKKTLTIIIVSWNVCEDVIQCIESIYKNPPSSSYEIILVDNASSDDTILRVRERFPKVILIENTQNMGFAAANNRGIQRANGEYVFFLNPDTIILQNSLDKLIAFMKVHPDVGLCGPQILNSDMTIQRSVRKFPTFKAIFYRFTILKYLGLFRKYFYQWTMRDFDHKKEIVAEQLIGAALIARTSLVRDLGGFDECFFMYYEEVDLCLRIKKAGFKVIFYPTAAIVHLGGRSAKQIPARVKFMMLKSLVLFMSKHHSSPTGHFLIFLFKIGVFTRQFFEMTIYFIASVFSLGRPRLLKKNFLRSKSCFLFLIKHYIPFLFA